MSTARPRVLVPRPVGRAETLLAELRAAGLAAEHQPFFELRLESDSDLRAAVADLAGGAFDWLVLTSAVAVDALLALAPPAAEGEPALPVPETTSVAVVGEGTAKAVRRAGLTPDLIAAGSGESLVEQMPAAPGRGRVLLPVSSAAAPTVPEGLAARGWQVQHEIAYRPRALSLDPAVVDGLRTGRYDALLLTSSMIARMASSLPIHLSTRIITIGAPTTATAQEAGLRVDAEAADPSDAALITAVRAALDARSADSKEDLA